MSEYSSETTEEFVSEEVISEEEIQSIVTESIEDAVDFIDNTISPGDRATCKLQVQSSIPPFRLRGPSCSRLGKWQSIC